MYVFEQPSWGQVCITCLRLLHDLFFLGFPDLVKVSFVDCFKLADVGIAVVAGMLDEVGIG